MKNYFKVYLIKEVMTYFLADVDRFLRKGNNNVF
jgi:hypothetical protein